ncbi:geranylgeranylglycerol-phosphate geranylgeranyltransferase [Halobium salinum]|uniref:Digeranylgeranylglyceryl phosphate synthase n=1 Tax=Halobium salinum TaxID=1364940 RepID=A0ABD5P6X8_9EURY|nr:geranylgeranylglycerol-phosphate geranylgeranyltransferase [Halobium salinum]
MTVDERSAANATADFVQGLVELSRLGNVLAAGALTFIGAFTVLPLTSGSEDVAAMGFAVGATVFATAAGNAINDYFDADIDAINRPNRAIPRGAVSEREALVFSACLFLGAVVCALQLPPAAIAVAVVNLLALVAYTKFFKGLPGVGNVVVGYLTGSTFLFGGLAVLDSASDPYSLPTLPVGLLVLFALAATATFTREAVKDVEDLEGDRQEGLRTLPIVLGERPTLWLGVVAMVAAVAASGLPYLVGTFGRLYLALIVPADGLLLGATVHSFRDPTRSQELLKTGMLLASGAFLVSRVAVLVGFTL